MAKCMAYRDDGRICGAEAIVVDRVRGCMVCGEHAPKCERCEKPADVYGSGTPPMTDSREHHLGLNPDTARLDWLQRCNDAMNAHYGTVYGWRVHRSDCVTRLMSGRGGEGYPGDIDVYDYAPMCRDPKQAGHPTIREAIDKAMAGDGYAPPAVTPAPPSNLTGEEREMLELARTNGAGPILGTLFAIIDRLDAKLTEVTRERDNVEDRITDAYNALYDDWDGAEPLSDIDHACKMMRQRAEKAEAQLADAIRQWEAALEAKERAEAERDKAIRFAESKQQGFVEGAARIAEAVKPLDAAADTYHTIRQSLGMDPDVDPQEVVDAVGGMREQLNRLPKFVDTGEPITVPFGFIVRITGADRGAWTYAVARRSTSLAWRGHAMYSTKKAALAAQRKEGE